ncbi:hypothetical protein EJ110_NYTH22444 [Nymphaea thermarum]|nr:hypothetical protein EJ110_NYTH22444 [Nymphaea thermarum]
MSYLAAQYTTTPRTKAKEGANPVVTRTKYQKGGKKKNFNPANSSTLFLVQAALLEGRFASGEEISVPISGSGIDKSGGGGGRSLNSLELFW